VVNVNQTKIVLFQHSINVSLEFVSQYYLKMDSNVSHQMNAYQIYVWIQHAMGISWTILSAKIIMIVKAKFALIIYVTVLMVLLTIQIHLLKIKTRLNKIQQTQRILQIQQLLKLIKLFINKMRKMNKRIIINWNCIV